MNSKALYEPLSNWPNGRRKCGAWLWKATLRHFEVQKVDAKLSSLSKQCIGVELYMYLMAFKDYVCHHIGLKEVEANFINEQNQGIGNLVVWCLHFLYLVEFTHQFFLSKCPNAFLLPNACNMHVCKKCPNINKTRLHRSPNKL